MSIEEMAAAMLPRRPEDGNKGTFGKALLFAGSYDTAGAAILSSRSAYRAGAGLVRVVTTEENRIILQTAVPEALLFSYTADRFDLSAGRDLLDWCTVVLIGPGLSKSKQAKELFRFVRKEAKTNVVFDADALNLAAEEDTPSFGPRAVLTPHMKEMSRLTGVSVSALKADREKYAQAFSEKTGAVVVLKDNVTVVASPGEEGFLYEGNNSGLATGGSGDVLAGILAGLLAGGMERKKAAVLAVLLHGMAGTEAAKEKGVTAMIASDVADALPKVLKKLEDIKENME